MVRPSSQHQHERENDQAADGQHFDRAQPKFQLSEKPDAEVINRDDGDEEDGDEHPRVDVFSVDPILDDQGPGRELIGGDDDILEPVRISQTETQGGIAKSCRVAGEAGFQGQPRGHFPQRAHDEKDDESDDGVGDEDRERTTAGQGGPGSDDETGADGASDGDHGDLTGLQSSAQTGVGIGHVVHMRWTRLAMRGIGVFRLILQGQGRRRLIGGIPAFAIDQTHGSNPVCLHRHPPGRKPTGTTLRPLGDRS